MRLTALLLSLAVMTAACAHVEPEPQSEVIAYQAPVGMLDSMAAAPTWPQLSRPIFMGFNQIPEVDLRSAATTQLAATKVQVFTNLNSAFRSNSYVQVIDVFNYDTTGYVCMYPETWAQTCASSIAFTCLGATLQGVVIPPGTFREIKFDGAQQPCAVGNEAAIDVQFERQVYFLQQ